MEAIVPAFLLALLTQYGDRPALLTAIFADRFERPLLVALMAGVAHTAGNMLAAVAGVAIAPMLNPNAQALMLSIALLFGGVGGLWPMKLPSRFERWRLGPVVTPLVGVSIVALGERTQFLTLAIGLGGMPWLAAAGGALGCFAVAFVAAVLGETGWRGMTLRWARLTIGAAMLASGLYVGLGALRLL